MSSTHNDENGPAARITAVVGSWPEVEVAPHDFGATGFTLGRRQLGHLHGDSVAEIPFPRRIRDELVATGRAQPRQRARAIRNRTIRLESRTERS